MNSELFKAYDMGVELCGDMRTTKKRPKIENYGGNFSDLYLGEVAVRLSLNSGQAKPSAEIRIQRHLMVFCFKVKIILSWSICIMK